MKRFLCFLLSLLFIIGTSYAAPQSPTNTHIAEAKVIKVIPEDPTQPVVMPVVQLVDDTDAIIALYEDLRPKPIFILFDYEVPLGLGFSNHNLGICFE